MTDTKQFLEEWARSNFYKKGTFTYMKICDNVFENDEKAIFRLPVIRFIIELKDNVKKTIFLITKSLKRNLKKFL